MASAAWLAARGIINLNPDEDPRVGSGREDSNGGGTLSANAGSKGSSLSKLGATFIPVAIYLAVCFILFFILRRRCPRIYAPRCIAPLRAPEEPTPSLPNGWFNWIKPFFQVPDTFVLNYASLDSFFFLRFIKLLRNICFAGCCILWPVLFPIHATGGRGLTELEMLSIGNVENSSKLFAHAAVAWIFFGFVLFSIVRESIYYVNIRQAYLSSPYYASRLSSRTVLFTCVPDRYLDEHRLRKLYGDSVRRIWIPYSSKSLVYLVKEREQTALRLEKAEIELIRTANRVRRKQERAQAKKLKKSKGNEPQLVAEVPSPEHSASHQQDQEASSDGSVKSLHTAPSRILRVEAEDDIQTHGRTESLQEINDKRITDVAETANPTSPASVSRSQLEGSAVNGLEKTEEAVEDESEYVHPYGLDSRIPDVRGSVAAQYIPAEGRPHHRPLGNFGRRVDTIRWTRLRLSELNVQIFKLRRRLRRGDGHPADTLPAVFIEFDSQEAAQAAHQILAHHQPFHMAPRLLGVRPDEVVWSSLRIRWWARVIRRFAVLGLIVAAIVFWSIPSALVGLISNVESLSKNITFLYWIGDLPKPITGFLTGFVPAFALSLFMALVPVMLRGCAVLAGVPTLNMVELFTQTGYFAFQVVQVFLITTLTSAASSAFFDILMNPMIAKDMLAKNLPKASNFYISYILIQCLFGAGNTILQPFDLIRHAILSRITQFPRSRYRLWHTLRPTRWGRDFPVYANMGVIALCYACIAPLILIFAAVGMAATHLVWRYNLIYVLDSDMDTKGLFYPRALTHLTVGIYLACFCLMGLFFINSAVGPGVMMAIFLVLTAMVHFSLVQSTAPLLQNLPQTLSLEEQIQMEEKNSADNSGVQGGAENTQGLASSYYDMEEAMGEDEPGVDIDDEDDDEPSGPTGTRAMEGASEARSVFVSWFMDLTKKSVKEQVESLGLSPSDQDSPPSFISKWLNPHLHEDFIAIRKNIMTLPDTPPEVTDDVRRTYYPPEMWMPKPILWIPRDEARVSRQEVAHTRESTPISDKGATLDEYGRVSVEVEAAPFALPRLLI